MSYTNEQLELKAHIEKENEAFTAECKARGATFWTTVVTDLDFWAGMEVTTIAEYEHHQAMSTHWDFFKELNGFRPRFMDYKSMTVEQINAEIDLLHKQAEAEAEYERQLIEAEKAEQQRWKEANAYKPNLAFEGLTVKNCTSSIANSIHISSLIVYTHIYITNIFIRL